MVSAPAPVIDTSDMDPELARYLNRNYWQQKSVELKTSATQPSAPSIATDVKMSTAGGAGGGLSSSAPMQTVSTAGRDDERYQNGEASAGSGSAEDREQFLAALRSSIEIFVNRMRSNSQRGRSIANDSSVQTLFMTLTAMHPQLLQHIHQQEDQRAHYETMQDKLAQLKDARDALNVLREEHREKRRREQEELERLRQIQMAQKLEVLRQKKQEYLEYQRQLALQRMHEQEMEMRRRLELQKQEQQMRAMQYSYPQMYSSAPGVPAYSTVAPPGDGSSQQMHSYAPASQPYYSLPAPPGAPANTAIPTTGITAAGSQMPGYVAPPATMGGQPQQYNVATAQGYQPHTVPGGPGGAYQAPTQQGQQTPMTQMYVPAATTSAPPQQLAPPPTVAAEYQPYNMHAMAGALPQQPAGYMAPNSAGGGAQYVGGPGQPQAPVMGHAQGTVAAPGQVQHRQPGPNEASLAALISFD